MNILNGMTALPNSVFKFDCWFFSCGYCSEEITFNGKLLRAYLWWCFICSRWHMDVCDFLLEMTHRPLKFRTLVERAKLHPSFQKPGIDSVHEWANLSAHHAKLLQPIGVPICIDSFPEGCLVRGHSWLSLNALFRRTTWQLFTLTSLVPVGLLRKDKVSPSLFATSRRHASFQFIACRRLHTNTGDWPMSLRVRAACGDTTRGNCALAPSASRSQPFSSLAL